MGPAVRSITTPDEFPAMVDALRIVTQHQADFSAEEWPVVLFWIQRGVAFMELNLSARPGDGGAPARSGPADPEPLEPHRRDLAA